MKNSLAKSYSRHAEGTNVRYLSVASQKLRSIGGRRFDKTLIVPIKPGL